MPPSLFTARGPGAVAAPVAAAILVVASCGGAADEAIRTVRIYDLVTALPRAVLQAPGSEYVAGRTEAIGTEQRRVIFMHPPSSAEFPAVVVRESSVLTFAIGIQDEAWDRAGDGVEFVVRLKSARAPEGLVIFSRYINPKRNPNDRGWLPMTIPLRRFAGESIQLVLSTSPGPANDRDSDWAVWGDPEIFLDSRSGL